MSAERTPSRAKRSDWVSAMVVTSNLAFVLAPIYLAARVGASPACIALWIWFGLGMQGILNLMHETAHLHVFRSRAANELLGRWILGPLMFADFDRYREVHWAHHRNVGKPDDPKYSYKIDIRGWAFARFVFRSLTLIEAIRKFRYVHGAKPTMKSSRDRAWLVRTALVQCVFVASLVLTVRGGALQVVLYAAFAYGFVYFYGILSLTVMAANLRAIAEHQLWGDRQLEVADSAALRNLSSNPLTWLIFGSYGFSEHATHHRAPAIPYYLLPAEVRRLGAEHARAEFGYVSILIGMIGSRGENRSIRPARSLLTF